MNTKCKVNNYCDAMERFLAPEANARVKGLSTVLTFNIETGIQKTVGIRMRSKPNDNGLMLNCCPWCKANLEWWKK